MVEPMDYCAHTQPACAECAPDGDPRRPDTPFTSTADAVIELPGLSIRHEVRDTEEEAQNPTKE